MEQWMYTDTQGAQKGPLAASVLFKLLERGTGLVDGSTLVWKQGMDQWRPMKEVDIFQQVLEAANKQWYYIDSNGDQKGPLITRGIVERASAGDIDGLSLVWNSSMPVWLPLGEVQELKALLQQAAQDQDILETTQEAGEFHEEMVFEDNAEQQPKLEIPKKRIVGDDGLQYVFNEETQEWVEADKDDQESDDEPEPHWKRKLAQKRKAQAESAEKEEEASVGDGDESESVGGPDEGEQATSVDDQAAKKKKKKKSKKKRALDWSDNVQNNWIYVSGLPANVTEEELIEHFSKAGVLAINPATTTPKVKLYKDDAGVPKGDASLCFARAESVESCLNYFDGGFLRPGVKLEVKRAEFSKRDGQQQQPRSRLNAAQVKVAKAAMKQALGWMDEHDTGVDKSTALKIVVIHNMFRPEEFNDPSFSRELEVDIASECEKLGPLEKITVFEKNPQGVVIVKFGTAFAAAECIRVFNGRFFAGRKLRCHYWDGVTDYTVRDTREEESRLEEMGDWLEQQEVPEEFQLRVEGEP